MGARSQQVYLISGTFEIHVSFYEDVIFISYIEIDDHETFKSVLFVEGHMNKTVLAWRRGNPSTSPEPTACLGSSFRGTMTLLLSEEDKSKYMKTGACHRLSSLVVR